jgi:uncharacterized protein (DUF1800 family)
MMARRPSRRILLVILGITTTASALAGQRPGPVADNKTAVHVLNRLGYGPAPGDVERLQRMGIDAYVEAQLNPAAIADDKLRARLEAFETLTLSTREQAERYFLPALQQRRAAQRANAQDPEMRDMKPGEAPRLPRSPEMMAERRVMQELTQQKVLRAAYSDRQLEEVMVDFWFNHFNVFAGKGQTRLYLTEYERDTIRPRVFGRFRDLLGAVAESPAMLFYLDNWQSAAPDEAETMMGRAGRGRRPLLNRPAPNRRRGINENFARELMELHTTGVDGGYTQKDVQEVARAFTGWTIDAPRQGGGFRFDPRIHDNGEKIVLGTRIPRGGGKRDGELVLDLLAAHPSTAKFIATKLARRFVSDDPPRALVERAARTFTESNGDLRQVVRTIITSKEFFAPDAYRAKVKTPLEFVASAVRASGVDVRNAMPLVQAVNQLGMPLYMCQPPTGYADKAEAWVNTGTLLNRMNFALTLATNRAWAGDGERTSPQQVAAEILAADVSPQTKGTVAKATADRQALALLLGSPEFQRR